MATRRRNVPRGRVQRAFGEKNSALGSREGGVAGGFLARRTAVLCPTRDFARSGKSKSTCKVE